MPHLPALVTALQKGCFYSCGCGCCSPGNAHALSASPERATGSWCVSPLPCHFPTQGKPQETPFLLRSTVLLWAGPYPEQLLSETGFYSYKKLLPFLSKGREDNVNSAIGLSSSRACVSEPLRLSLNGAVLL